MSGGKLSNSASCPDIRKVGNAAPAKVLKPSLKSQKLLAAVDADVKVAEKLLRNGDPRQAVASLQRAYRKAETADGTVGREAAMLARSSVHLQLASVYAALSRHREAGEEAVSARLEADAAWQAMLSAAAARSSSPSSSSEAPSPEAALRFLLVNPPPWLERTAETSVLARCRAASILQAVAGGSANDPAAQENATKEARSLLQEAKMLATHFLIDLHPARLTIEQAIEQLDSATPISPGASSVPAGLFEANSSLSGLSEAELRSCRAAQASQLPPLSGLDGSHRLPPSREATASVISTPPPSAPQSYNAEIPTQESTIKLLGPIMLEKGATFRKIGKAFLKRANTGDVLETGFDGKVETVNTAKHGDWIVRADTSAKERYFVGDEKFQKLYEPAPVGFAEHPDAAELQAEGFNAYRPRGRILAVQATKELVAQYFPQGKFFASWGSEMLVEFGDILAAPAPPDATGPPNTVTEVYRIEQGAFAQTYAAEASAKAEAEPLAPPWPQPATPMKPPSPAAFRSTAPPVAWTGRCPAGDVYYSSLPKSKLPRLAGDGRKSKKVATEPTKGQLKRAEGVAGGLARALPEEPPPPNAFQDWMSSFDDPNRNDLRRHFLRSEEGAKRITKDMKQNGKDFKINVLSFLSEEELYEDRIHFSSYGLWAARKAEKLYGFSGQHTESDHSREKKKTRHDLWTFYRVEPGKSEPSLTTLGKLLRESEPGRDRNPKKQLSKSQQAAHDMQAMFSKSTEICTKPKEDTAENLDGTVSSLAFAETGDLTATIRRSSQM